MSRARADEPMVNGLVGRTSESAHLDSLLQAARNGRSGVLVLHGEAGIGKTALLDRSRRSAQDMEVVHISGVESEAALSFAGLHRLLVPFLDRVDALVPRQRQALESALGLGDAAPADRFLVGLAVLTLLSDVAATSSGVLCLVDDVQWLDRESLDILSFVGRRLHADRIVMLLALRDEPGETPSLPDGLPEMKIEPLADADMQRLLRTVAARPVHESVERRLVDAAGGSPLALIELASELSDEQLIGGDLLPDPLPVGERLEAHFLNQVRRLPADTQTLLLVAAAEPSGDASPVWRAAIDLGIDPSASDATASGGLLVLDPGVRFRHPLIRSAVYRGAVPSDRRRVHLALAAASDGDAERDRRAWHLASASIGPDAAVADELDRAADRARTRGGYAAAGSFRARAAELTPDRTLRTERFLTAAQSKLMAGAPRQAAELLDRAELSLDDPRLRAQAQRVRAGLQSYSAPGSVASLLLSAAATLAPVDVRSSRDTYAEAIQAALVSCQLTTGVTLAEVARAVLAAPEVPGSPATASDLLMEGFATRLAVGHPQAVPALRAAIARLSTEDDRANPERWAVLANNLAQETWELRDSRRMLDRFETIEREDGALESLRVTLGGLAHLDMWNGEFDAAEVRHTEAASISSALGEDAMAWEMLKVELWAWQGREEDTRFVVDLLTGEIARSYGAGCVVNIGRMALTILEVALGNYREAFDAASQVLADDVPPQSNQSLPEVVEAGARCGQIEAARSALAVLEQRATASGTPWALGLLARSRAVLADDADAEPLYREALERFESEAVRTESARTHLLLGEWLRRRNRRIDSREHLRTACTMFESMGAQAFAARARAELAATGERARRRTVETANDLTPQESQIAALAAGGATNREIAASLFISSSTVDYHLRKVFRKVGVSSRRQLADSLRPRS